MATYDIGSKSLIFKRISMFLQETYMSTLEVSDEYTLDLAKCIYEYLRDFYPNTYQYWLPVMSQPSDFTKVLQDKYQDKYYKRISYIDNNGNTVWTNEYILASEQDIWADNTYFVKGMECTISDIYTIGMPIGLLGDDTLVYNDYFPGIYTYELLGYTKDLPAPSAIKTLTDEQKIYSITNTTPFLKVLDNPELSKLNQKYQTETSLRQQGQKTLSDREYNLLKNKMDFIIESRTYFASAPRTDTDAENVLKFVTDGLSWVNQYNIYSWPINETLLQFLTPDLVITEASEMDDIAQMQLLAKAVNYIPGENLGLFDSEFEQLCRAIQEELKQTNSRIIVTGYCDIFVERYLRSKNDIRTEVY